MSSTLFGLTFALAAPFWALMILAPRWSWTGRIVGSPLIVVPVLLVYAALVLPSLGAVLPVVTAPTLDGLRDLLGSADGAAAAWAHMIAFDLFAGRWIWQDARERGLPALLTAPVLLLTVLLGPVGLAVHLGLRAGWPRPVNAVAPAAPVA
ncbi:ABA4-like family protein [Micromonospora sp. B006]|uniref:ABA4-like family protein n=1 Tax=Micromonospora sp. B006 TaxID=2201999 RepID=UPI000E30521C|nr:ABA4-like family protein [Micromonospora sp. B006]AXO34649.1 hypothetical protein MicB006_2367 [Micromonospora sp. B006]